MVKKCSVCGITGVPMKQLNVPSPPFHLFYCEKDWNNIWKKVKPIIEQFKSAGLSRSQAQKEMVERSRK